MSVVGARIANGPNRTLVGILRLSFTKAYARERQVLSNRIVQIGMMHDFVKSEAKTLLPKFHRPSVRQATAMQFGF